MTSRFFVRAALCVLLLPAFALRAQAPTEVAVVTDMQLSHRFFGPLAESPCGADWYVIEGSRWMCARPNQAGRWRVTEFGQFAPNLNRLVRGPLGSERRMIFGVQNTLSWWDPVTHQVQPLGELPGGIVLDTTQSYPLLVDHDGDGRPEMVVRPAFGSQLAIVALPGGPVPALQQVGTIPEPWHITPGLVGQFDADSRTELVRFEPTVLRFLDVGTVQEEAFSVAGSFDQPSLALNWDGDPNDEMVLARSGQPTVALVDLGGVVRDISVAGSGLLRGYAPVNWSGDQRPELAVVWESKIAVVDPRTGSILANFDWFTPDLHFRRPTVVDWEQDADQDALWLDDGMILLRNPQGPERLQFSSSRKKPLQIRATPTGPILISLEEETGWGRSASLLSQRDPDTLALRSFAKLENCTDLPTTLLGRSADDSIGVVYCAGLETLRAFAATTGQPLWTRVLPSVPSANFWRAVEPADDTCIDVACNRALIVADSIETGPHIELIDAQSGNPIHVIDLPGSSRVPAIALTDMTGDGNPDLLYSEDGDGQPGSPPAFMTAVNGATFAQLWRVPMSTKINDFVRFPQGRRRLLAVDEYANTYLVDVTTGRAYQRGQFPGNSCSVGCMSGYFTHPYTPGYFAANGLYAREDLGRVIQFGTGSQYGTVDGGNGRALLGVDSNLSVVQFPADDLMPDGFEDW